MINKQIILEENNYFPEDQDLSLEIQIPHFFPTLDIKNLKETKNLFSKNIIFYSFNSPDLTKFLQKCLINASKDIITFIIDELKGSFREVIKNKNGNFFFFKFNKSL